MQGIKSGPAAGCVCLVGAAGTSDEITASTGAAVAAATASHHESVMKEGEGRWMSEDGGRMLAKGCRNQKPIGKPQTHIIHTLLFTAFLSPEILPFLLSFYKYLFIFLFHCKSKAVGCAVEWSLDFSRWNADPAIMHLPAIMHRKWKAMLFLETNISRQIAPALLEGDRNPASVYNIGDDISSEDFGMRWKAACLRSKWRVWS